MNNIPVFNVTAADFSRLYVAEVHEELRRLPGEGGFLVLDLACVSYVDSVALTLLHDLDELCRKQGGKLMLAGVHPGVVRVFETMGLEIQLSATVDMAIDQITAGQ